MITDITEIIENRLHNLRRPNTERTEDQIKAKSAKNKLEYEKRRARQLESINGAPNRQAAFYDFEDDPAIQAYVEATKLPDDVDDADEYASMDVMGKTPQQGKKRMSTKKKSTKALVKTTSIQSTTSSFGRTESFQGRNRKADRVLASMALDDRIGEGSEDKGDDQWEDPSLFAHQKNKNKIRDRRGEPLPGSSNGAIQVLLFTLHVLIFLFDFSCLA